jgi:hypothetical protein
MFVIPRDVMKRVSVSAMEPFTVGPVVEHGQGTAVLGVTSQITEVTADVQAVARIICNVESIDVMMTLDKIHLCHTYHHS